MSIRHAARVRPSHQQRVEAHPAAYAPPRVSPQYVEPVQGSGDADQQVGSVDGGSIVPQTIDLTPLASSLRPPVVVAALPTLPDVAYPVGSYAVVASTKLLYKNVADVWTAVSPTDALVAGEVTAGVITAGAVSTAQLAAGAVTTEKLALKDEFNQTVLTASGFGPAWTDYISHGLYNPFFSLGAAQDPMTMGRTATLPYWTASKNSGTTVKVVADTTNWPGGRYVEATLTSNGHGLQLLSDMVPVVPGAKYRGEMWLSLPTNSGGATVQFVMSVDWYRADGTTLASVNSGSLALDSWNSTIASPMLWRGATSPATSPMDARFARVTVAIQYLAGTITNTVFRVGGARLVEVLGSAGLDPGGVYSAASLDISTNLRVENYGINPASFLPSAFPVGWITTDAHSTAASLAAVTGGNGGARAIPIVVQARMRARAYVLWNTDTASARSCEMRLYKDVGTNSLEFVTGSDATLSFTPTVASRRSATMSGTSVYLSPGVYWLVIRNTSTTQTFGLGYTAATDAIDPTMNLGHTGIASLGSTIDLSSGWSESSAVFGIFIAGDLFSSFTAWGTV